MNKEKTKIILDTDMGSDSDDAGALALLHHLSDNGLAEILAVTHCASEISGPYAVKVINDYYGRGEIPIGFNKYSKFLEGSPYNQYTGLLMDEYLNNNSTIEFKDSIEVMRSTLSKNDNVTIAVIGMMNNLAMLLKSQSDSISPLSGIELVKNHVKDVYIMGGDFEDLSHAEFNVRNDIESAMYVAENCPVPICYCGFEIGDKVITGQKLKRESNLNPIKFAYSVHTADGLNNSWDPITVYCAVMKENNKLFKFTGGKNILFDSAGRVRMTDDGKDFYVLLKAEIPVIEYEIDSLIY
ncbi:MAG: nucleoside hydrolase [Eubacteriales bacterium]|nr:nucleoside hydrolase [Eubacteriales bacterium]MDY5229958.1 nucleoside hydrolase [Eubacteriales bacterium]